MLESKKSESKKKSSEVKGVDELKQIEMDIVDRIETLEMQFDVKQTRI